MIPPPATWLCNRKIPIANRTPPLHLLRKASSRLLLHHRCVPTLLVTVHRPQPSFHTRNSENRMALCGFGSNRAVRLGEVLISSSWYEAHNTGTVPGFSRMEMKKNPPRYVQEYRTSIGSSSRFFFLLSILPLLLMTSFLHSTSLAAHHPIPFLVVAPRNKIKRIRPTPGVCWLGGYTCIQTGTGTSCLYQLLELPYVPPSPPPPAFQSQGFSSIETSH